MALSTCETDYIALAETVQEGKFLRQLCIDTTSKEQRKHSRR